MHTAPSITLNNDVQIPQLGFGAFKVSPEVAFQTVATALEIGYRHIDTAQMYENERQVGAALRHSGLRREDVWITSKLRNTHMDRDAILRSFDQSLADLGIDQLDLFLIHWPLPGISDYVKRWSVLEEIYAGGRVRAIGVSNFQVTHLRAVLANTDVCPAINQVECHPFLVQDELRAFHAEYKIVTEAWAPIARGAVNQSATLHRIGRRLGRTPAQVALRWHIQRGDVVFPKSSRPERMRENLDVWDFALGESDMAAITMLDRHERTGPDPDTFNPQK